LLHEWLKLAGLTEVPVKVIEADEPMIRRLQLHENIHRANLTPLEVAEALNILLTDGETQETLATMLCKSVAYVQKAITIAQRLSAPAKALVESNASRFASLDLLYDVAQTPEDQQEPLLLRIKDERLTRVELREIVAPLKNLAKASRGTSRGRKAQDGRYSRAIPVDDGTVTVTIRKPHVSKLEIIRALKQAIQAVHADPDPAAPSHE
jgi:ParB family chromosome partitioning protein